MIVCSSYVSTYIGRDIRKVQSIQDLNIFQSFISLCAAYHGQEVSYTALSRKFGISQPTVKEWISLTTASFVTLLLTRTSRKRVVRVHDYKDFLA